jgi:two-component system, OmpR family, catabolic regulation response regulator CreB
MKPRILIIEDEPAIADNIVYALETEGFQCKWCATGGEGLAALDAHPRTAALPGNAGEAADAPGSAKQANPEGAFDLATNAPFDLAVLDVGLPDIGGFDLCREIRKRHDLPILFLTARAGEIDRVVGLELGADDYVVKPFSPRELAARIKAILRRTSVPRSSAASPGEARSSAVSGASVPFRVDAERMVISYFDAPLDLARYEYRLLIVLLEKPGRVWSREQLMERAWDSPESSLDRTVDAHVKSLRAKLRAVRPEVDPIRTHRGMGYSLKEEW